MIPNIEFPCPSNYDNMTTTSAGAYCKSCEKEVVDVSKYTPTELEQLMAANPNQCVSYETQNSIPQNSSYSIRQFGLALLLIFGSSVFTIADAQVQEDINTISVQLLEKEELEVGGFLNITCESRDGRSVYTSVTVILPNGREEEVDLKSDGTYHYKLPAYTAGKDVLIIAKARKNTKRYSITIPKDLNPDEVFMIFSNKNATRFMGRMIGCPSF